MKPWKDRWKPWKNRWTPWKRRVGTWKKKRKNHGVQMKHLTWKFSKLQVFVPKCSKHQRKNAPNWKKNNLHTIWFPQKTSDLNLSEQMCWRSWRGIKMFQTYRWFLPLRCALHCWRYHWIDSSAWLRRKWLGSPESGSWNRRSCMRQERIPKGSNYCVSEKKCLQTCKKPKNAVDEQIFFSFKRDLTSLQGEHMCWKRLIGKMPIHR